MACRAFTLTWANGIPARPLRRLGKRHPGIRSRGRGLAAGTQGQTFQSGVRFLPQHHLCSQRHPAKSRGLS